MIHNLRSRLQPTLAGSRPLSRRRALDAVEPPLDWGRWFMVALPVSGVSIVFVWLLLLVSYRPSRLPTEDGSLETNIIRPTRDHFTWKQWWVIFVCITSIALWVVEHGIEGWRGDMGVIAIIPIVAFFWNGRTQEGGGNVNFVPIY